MTSKNQENPKDKGVDLEENEIREVMQKALSSLECPVCSLPMKVLRNNEKKKEHVYYFGCWNFPHCEGILDINTVETVTDVDFSVFTKQDIALYAKFDQGLVSGGLITKIEEECRCPECGDELKVQYGGVSGVFFTCPIFRAKQDPDRSKHTLSSYTAIKELGLNPFRYVQGVFRDE